MRKLAFLMVLVLVGGCAQPWTKTQQGAAIGTGVGTLAGAGLGQAIGGNTKGTLIGAGIGAVLGGLAGGSVGRYMDNQELALRQQFEASQAADIERQAAAVAVTFKSDVLFNVGSANINSGGMVELNRVSQVLLQYPKTNILICGHTDDTGSGLSNQQLSEARAEAVKRVLMAQGVSVMRITTAGYGEGQPVATNATEAGRQLNRRVVITISPSALG